MKQPLPYFTLFFVETDIEANRKVLREYLRARAQEGWRVEASDAKLPEEGTVYHVSPDDLPAPPVGVTAKLRATQAEPSAAPSGAGSSSSSK